jgi:hypothetical protein
MLGSTEVPFLAAAAAAAAVYLVPNFAMYLPPACTVDDTW